MARRPATPACVLRFASLALLGMMESAAATTIHKCRDAAGQVSYRDDACPPGTEVTAPVLAPVPPYEMPAPASAPALAPAHAVPTTANQPRPPPPPLPALYGCERYDGQERYVTTDPVPRMYQVPLWAVLPDRTGVSGGGVGMSRATAGRAPIGAYTTVQDQCHAMGRAELCVYWAQRAETVRTRLMTAFNDTRPQLEQEQAGLRENRAVHCGT